MKKAAKITFAQSKCRTLEHNLPTRETNLLEQAVFYHVDLLTPLFTCDYECFFMCRPHFIIPHEDQHKHRLTKTKHRGEHT